MTLQIPSYCNDLSYPFWTLRKHIAATVPPGALGQFDMFVSASGLQVIISSGSACIKQTVNVEGSTQYNGAYFVVNDAPASPYNTITVPVSNPRIDQVIARVYDVNEQGLSGSSFARFEWLTGSETPGANLTNLTGAATLPDNSLRLAYVLQTVGEGSISGANIVQTASGWIPITLPSGFTSQSGSRLVSVKLINGIVFFKGIIVNVSGTSKAAGSSIGTLPSGYAPNGAGIIAADNSNNLVQFWIVQSPGTLVTPTGYTFSSTGEIFFDNCSCSIF